LVRGRKRRKNNEKKLSFKSCVPMSEEIKRKCMGDQGRLARMASVLVGGVGSHHQLQEAWSGVNDMNKCKKVIEEEEETKVKGGDKMDVTKLLQQHVDLMDDMFKEV
jgi:hypothetical protein